MKTESSVELELRTLQTDTERAFLKPVFVFEDYQSYLNDMIDVHHHVRGLRTKIADAANCQPSHLTQVLQGTAHFSLDQLYGVARYFELTEPEWEFLRELWLLSRASNFALRAECKARIEKMRTRYGAGVGSVPSPTREVATEKFHLFGTSWHHGAVYVALEITTLRTPAALSKRLGIPLERTKEVLNELKEMALANDENGVWKQTVENYFMDWKSPYCQMYRTHWFMKGCQQFQNKMQGYGGGASFAVSRKKFEMFRERGRQLMHEIFLDTDPEDQKEVVGYMGVDLFEV